MLYMLQFCKCWTYRIYSSAISRNFQR